MTSKHYILDTIYADIKNTQVTRSELQYAPNWILDDALVKEYEDNWKENVAEIEDSDVPRNSNVISSHVVYKLKVDEEDIQK